MARVAVGRSRRTRWVGPPVPVAVARVRHDLPCVLRCWRVDEDVIDDVATVVTELLENVLRHARTWFCVVLELDERHLYVAVKDDLPGAAPPPSPKTAAARRSGLRLVNAVALRWGWYEQDAGKTVWAEFLA